MCHYSPTRVAIRLAKKATTTAVGTGTALISLGNSLLSIPGALHVPTLNRTLVAVSQLAKQGSLQFTGNRFWFTRSAPPPPFFDIIATGAATNRVYAFDIPHNSILRASPTPNATTRANRFVIPLKHLLAHNTFNHMNTDKQKYMKCKQLLSPTSHVLLSDPIQCRACFTGKATRAPHTPRSKAPLALNLINLDAVGPFPTSRRGNRFCCITVDDASGYPAAVVAKTKKVFKQTSPSPAPTAKPNRYHTYGRRPATLQRADKEMGRPARHGYRHHSTNHSASNGLSERTIRTLQESARAALYHGNMTHEYWDYAIEDAAAKQAVIPSDRSHE
jgi:hypothetical protein